MCYSFLCYLRFSDDTTGELLVCRFTGLPLKVLDISESYNKLVESDVEFPGPLEKQH